MFNPLALTSRQIRSIALVGLLAALGVALPLPIAQAQAQSSLSVQRRQMVFGVVQSPENADQWQGMVDRLQASGISYQVLDWQQVRRAEDFGNLTVLLLPNVEMISAEQLLALQSWMNQGGRVIASGITGSQSSPGVQWALRSLLGAYWSEALEQPATLQQVTHDRSQTWVTAGVSDRPISGGQLITTGLGSQILMGWGTDPANQGAIVVTQQTIYLGWEWGSSASAEVDESWLKAAISRFHNLTAPLASAPLAEAAPMPAPAANVMPPQRSPLSPIPAPPDPAEQTAPPGLAVELNRLPISPIEAIAMRQELENLMGRFASALLAADVIAADGIADAALASAPANQLTSSVGALPLGDRAAQTNVILQKAEQNLEEFSRLMRQRKYSAARQQWLATRQLLWDNFPTDRPVAGSEIRAMWLDRGTIVQAGSRQGLEKIFDRLAASGINTIFFETVNAGYPIYPSQVAPQQNPLTLQWNPLKEAVELAHERDMELHAWVWVFAAGNQAHNPLVQMPSDYPGPILAAHPDWANYDDRGSMIPLGQTKPFLDPANPAVRQYLLQMVEEIVTDYDVDGLQLDYIRYPFQDPSAGRTYGYGTAARQQFQALAGVDPMTLSPQNPRQQQLWQQWTEFRLDQINSFVADTSRLVHRLKPDLILSTAVFAMPEHQRIQQLQQDWELWASQGDVDLIVLMSYAMDTNRLQQLTTPWLEGNTGSALVVPGIRLLNLPNATVVDQIQSLRDSSAGGYALFATANLRNSLQGIFRQTQGNLPAPIPYRQPFAAAVDRYQSLLKEWRLLQSQNQLWIQADRLQTWQAQSEALAQALEVLADQPNAEHLQVAQTQLQDFQAKFKDWMHLQSLNQGYQVHTWESRLTTLANLLHYGDRRAQINQDSSQQASRGRDRSEP
ncbi:MAG TPA: family 10 glycosylhydrolase [Coleofasciculaceae cyanobacterium]